MLDPTPDFKAPFCQEAARILVDLYTLFTFYPDNFQRLPVRSPKITKNMKFIFALLLGMTFSAGTLLAQSEEMAAVFILGEQEQAYETLKQEHSQTLLEVTDYNTQEAFSHWMDMMEEMERYANKIKFDINGIKIWLHAFWNPDGSISHMGYLLRPNSRNIDKAKFAAFLKTFMKRYTFELTSNKPFSHYTGANFPIYGQKVDN